MAFSNIDAWRPALWAQEALVKLKAYLGVAKRVNRDYNDELQSYGKTVNVPIAPTIAAQLKVTGTPMTFTGVAATTIPVNLDKHITAPFEIDDVQAIQSRPDALAQYGNSAAIAIAEYIESQLMLEYVNASATFGVAGTLLPKTQLLSARNSLADAKAPALDNKFAFISTKDYGNLIGDLSTTDATAQQSGAELRDANLRRLYGFEIAESQLAPVVAGAPNSTYGIGFHRDAIVLVNRPLKAPAEGAGVRFAQVYDPDINMSIRVLMSYDHANTIHRVSYDALFGIKTVRPELLKAFLS